MGDDIGEDEVGVVLKRKHFLSIAAWVCGLLQASDASYDELSQLVGIFGGMPRFDGHLAVDALAAQLHLRGNGSALAREMEATSLPPMDFDTLYALLASLCETLISVSDVEDIRDVFLTIAEDDETWDRILRSNDDKAAAVQSAVEQINSTKGSQPS